MRERWRLTLDHSAMREDLEKVDRNQDSFEHQRSVALRVFRNVAMDLFQIRQSALCEPNSKSLHRRLLSQVFASQLVTNVAPFRKLAAFVLRVGFRDGRCRPVV